MLGWVKLNRKDLPKVLKFVGIRDSLFNIEARNTPEGWSTTIIDGKYKVIPTSKELSIEVVVNFVMVHESQGKGDFSRRKKFNQRYVRTIPFLL